MNGLDIWMRENPLAYIWLGSYAVALLIFAIEIAMVRHKRKITLQQLRLMREAEDEARDDKSEKNNKSGEDN
ncbi:MAG: heme exporter protein CcmD [Gallionella sp.]|nr:heme exporter protein CcmD [Gallionella sp.]